MQDPLFEIIGIKAAHVFAGAMGGALRAIVLKDGGVAAYMLAMFAGAVCAAYLGPLVAEWLRIENGGSMEKTVVFVAGVTGMTLVEVLLRAANKWKVPLR